MAIEIHVIMQVIIHAVIEATETVVQAIMVERGDETIRHRSEEAGVRPKLGGPSSNIQLHKRCKEPMQNL